ncbi:MAG: hypothetical protein Q9186_000980, partial [Xanthomendoza sp. 1 TL-2023]
RPVYGLVFLFKWREEDPDKQEPSCPEGICVALLNIVNNVPDLKLGDPLQQFKEFTAGFTPALRGDAIGNFEFVKTVHNSFARKMDMLNADLQLKNDASSRKKSKAKTSDEDDAGFHFIAFVPVQGRVWKLDGLERQPQNLGPITGDDWVLQVAPEIETRMAQYENGQIEFAILSLVQEPLTKMVAALAENVKSIAAVRQHLSKLPKDVEELQRGPMEVSILEEQDLVLGPCEQYELSQEVLDRAVLSPQIGQQLEDADVSDLVTVEKELIAAQLPPDETIRLMIDEAILDYLLYTAINSLLGLLDRDSAQKSHAHIRLQLVDSFLSMFRSLHHDHIAPAEIRFRLRLLRFTYVFTRHCHPPSASFPLMIRQPGCIEDAEDTVLENPFQEQQDTMSLQGTLPLFLALSAIQNALQESTITDLWMRLAAGYMAQSYVEQVLLCNNDHPSLLEESFRWGYEADCGGEENSDKWLINRMFGVDEYVVLLWEEIKEEHMQAASPCFANYLKVS